MWRHRKNDILIENKGRDVAMMTSPTQNQLLWNIVVNTNQCTKFGVPKTFGLEFRYRGIFTTHPCKMRSLNSLCKIGLKEVKHPANSGSLE